MDICVVGGLGHVGLPLSIYLAKSGFKVLVYDINEAGIKEVSKGKIPFIEEGSEALLKEVLQNGKLVLSSNPAHISEARNVILTIGTPVDEFLNPSLKEVQICIDKLLPHFRESQLLILRSTVYPGTTEWLANYLKKQGKPMAVAFCPERIIQGYAAHELKVHPQIVSGVTKEAEKRASDIFNSFAPSLVKLTPMEAEFAKLFSNAYRYIEFAIANQFYMITDSVGVDFHKVLDGMKKDYPRAANIPRPGFAAGPCLFKDTMQLASFANNHFQLGHAAMLVNEGLVLYLVDEMDKKHNIKNLRVGILGMAFKAENDDIRSSLSYKLKKVLQFRSKEVLTTDPFVKVDPDLKPLETVVDASDILILATPHKAYRGLNLHGKPVVDVWGFFRNAE